MLLLLQLSALTEYPDKRAKERENQIVCNLPAPLGYEFYSKGKLLKQP